MCSARLALFRLRERDPLAGKDLRCCRIPGKDADP